MGILVFEVMKSRLWYGMRMRLIWKKSASIAVSFFVIIIIIQCVFLLSKDNHK